MPRFVRLLFTALTLLESTGLVDRATAATSETVAAVDRVFRQPVAVDWFAPVFGVGVK